MIFDRCDELNLPAYWIIHCSLFQFEKTMETLEALSKHPMSASFTSFLTNYRKPVVVQMAEMDLPSVGLNQY